MSKSANTRRYGKVSFTDNKVRVTYKTGLESVLFEDISSISWNTRSLPNPYILLIGSVIGVVVMFFDELFLGASIVLVSSILMFFIHIKWDDIEIETKGGKLVTYAVDKGKGAGQMNLIEKKKREIVGK